MNDIYTAAIFLIPVLIYFILACKVMSKGLKTILILSTTVGFLHGFLFWVLFCMSEWRSNYGMPEIFQILFFSSLVGIVGIVLYSVLGTSIFFIQSKKKNNA